MLVQMMERWIVKLYLIFLLPPTIRVLSNIVQATPLERNTLEFIVLHNNDMHSRFEETDAHGNKCTDSEVSKGKCYGGFARLAHEIRRIRSNSQKLGATPVIYLNAGDTFSGTVSFSIHKDKIVTELIKLLNPDVICLGNHEFDLGTKSLIQFLNSVNCTVVAANLGLERSSHLKTATNLKKSTVISVKGTKVGIVGYLTPDTKYMSSADDVDIYPEIDYINQEAKTLKDAGVHIIIALGHSGFERDQEIALNCADIDFVIGGHTNTFLYNGPTPDIEKPVGSYPFIVTQPSGKRVPIVQAYAFTKYLGNIKLKFDARGDLIEWSGNPILLDSSVPQDEDVLHTLEMYRSNIGNPGNNVIGKTNVMLDGSKLSCRKGECNLGDLLADSLVYAQETQLKAKANELNNGAVIAFVQAGGIRSSIAKVADGAITYHDVLSVVPFNNTLYAITVNGSIIRSALERSAENYDRNKRNGGFLQISGLKVVFKMSNPVGNRIVELLAQCSECRKNELRPVENDKPYKIILSEFLLNGGDGHKWTDSSNPFLMAENLSITDLGAAINYIHDKSPIEQRNSSRIVLI